MTDDTEILLPTRVNIFTMVVYEATLVLSKYLLGKNSYLDLLLLSFANDDYKVIVDRFYKLFLSDKWHIVFHIFFGILRVFVCSLEIGFRDYIV